MALNIVLPNHLALPGFLGRRRNKMPDKKVARGISKTNAMVVKRLQTVKKPKRGGRVTNHNRTKK